ncbi:MAG: CPBP family intramembrane glutamic endopeptidase [Candidatus Krumholzibacteriia bacterium]
MSARGRNPVAMPLVWTLVGLAVVFWYVTFALPWSIFWIKISVAAAALAGLSLLLRPSLREQLIFGRRAWIEGVVAAAALYGIFWLGRAAATIILPFASEQIGAIYARGGSFPPAAIFLLLLLVTGPAEEIFWRGFLQGRLMERYGARSGWLIASAIYAGVHLWSLNLMLVGAAAVAGLFWGWLYWRWGRLAPVIISHSLWSAVIFAVAPMP